MDVSAEKRSLEKEQRLITLGQLSRTLAHEIRNPLTGISTMAQVLDGKIDEEDPRKKYIRQIIKETGRVNRIVKDILRYARPIEPFVSPVSIRGVIDEVLNSMTDKLVAGGVKVDVGLGEDLSPVDCDQELMGEVFGNIISNAVTSMGDGGRLGITGAMVQYGENESLRLWFRDEGSGSDVDSLEELFSPFYSTWARGTGLGLAVARKIVEAHGGKISALRNEEKGLTFVIEIPRQWHKENR